MVNDVMERRILVYIEAKDDNMEQLITQNVSRIVKKYTTSSISHQEEWALTLSTLSH